MGGLRERLQITGAAHLGLKPVNEMDNMGVVQFLEHVQLIIDHAFVVSNISLQDDLDCNLARSAVCFADNTICSGTKRSPESIQ